MLNTTIKAALVVFLLTGCGSSDTKGKANDTESTSQFAVIGYYSGNSTLVDSFPVEKLTHIISVSVI